jgi:uncharacterized protein DUF6487
MSEPDLADVSGNLPIALTAAGNLYRTVPSPNVSGMAFRMPDCPKCGRAMSPGFLGSESLVEGSKWFLERTRLAFGGEEIVKPNSFGMVYVEGFRCRDCHVLQLSY